MGPRSGKAGRHRVESRCAIQPALTVRVQEEETKHLEKGSANTLFSQVWDCGCDCHLPAARLQQQPLLHRL